MNQLFYGDNLEVLQKHIGDETVDLCYVDPPFNSKRNYNQIYNNVGKDDIAQSQAFVDTWSWGESAEWQLDILRKEPKYTRRLVDTILGLAKILGKGSMLAYLVGMTVRIAEIWRVLTPTGSFFLHCDPTASHYLKIILDSVFCDRGGDFRNEIIWGYQWGGVSKRNFARKHDVIFWYSKHKTRWTFNEKLMREPYTTKDTRWHNHEEGKLLRDIWDDIPIINTMSKERIGYTTQKPLPLLKRIIEACSNEGDTVLDAFCGCGTTVTAAHALNRKWIGIDITYFAVSLILKRLKDTYGNDIEQQIQLSGIPRDIESAKTLADKQDDRLRKEFEKWAILSYTDNHAKINDKKGSDGGIDGVAYILGGTALFSVKSGKVSVKDVRDLCRVIERDEAAAGILLTLEEPTKPMLQEAAAAGYMADIPSPAGLKMPHQTPKLRIVTIQEILDGKRMNFPLTEAVVKSATQHKPKNKNRQIDFENDVMVIDEHND